MQVPFVSLSGPAGLMAPAGGYSLAPLSGAPPGGLAPLTGGNMVPHQVSVPPSSAAVGGPVDMASAQANRASLEAAKAARTTAKADAKVTKAAADVFGTGADVARTGEPPVVVNATD